MQIFLGILLLVMSIFLIVAVLFQQGKSHRLPGAIAGGAETFFGKTKSRSINSILSKLTTVVAILFVVVVIIVYIMSGTAGKVEIPETDNTNTEEKVETDNKEEVKEDAHTEDETVEDETVEDETVEDNTDDTANEDASDDTTVTE